MRDSSTQAPVIWRAKKEQFHIDMLRNSWVNKIVSKRDQCRRRAISDTTNILRVIKLKINKNKCKLNL